MLMQPSMLERTLGHNIQMEDVGWILLHWVWIGISLLRAGANEVMWRNFSDGTWAIYNGIGDFAWIGVLIGATWLVAYHYWNGPEDA